MLSVALGAGLAGGVMPASAQAKIVTLTLLNGIKISLALPDGTPLDQLQLPQLNSPVVGISLSNPVAPTGTGGLPGLPGVGSTSVPSTLPAAAQAAPVVGAQKAQKLTGAKKSADTSNGAPFGSPAAGKAAPLPVATAFRQASGIPTVGNPTLTLAPIGAIPVGVPDFFIEKFSIPTFLLPIFQAAGVEYDVPWQVLAAINQVETDYGRNLSVSSAGAIGWMQFLPDTWKQYGVDATGSGVKDPYNPADAIFGAARFLHAAGAAQNLHDAIFAFNHANWYVDSVMLRAKLIGGLPADLVSSITGLTNGLFPVHAAARYADDVAETAALARAARSSNKAPLVTATAKNSTINIYAKSGSKVVAVQDGVITGIGSSPGLGEFVKLRDASGNTYTYSHLKSLSSLYAEPKPQVTTSARSARGLTAPTDPAPQGPASAGHQSPVAPAAASTAALQPASGTHMATDTPAGPQRLFANTHRKAVIAVGGAKRPAAGGGDVSAYLTQSSGLGLSGVNLKPLAKGARVLAGAVLGQIGVTAAYQAPHVGFQIRTAGPGAPMLDAKPILDGWKLLEATALYRGTNVNPLSGDNPTIGQVLLESKAQLQQQVLADPGIDIYPCGREDIRKGLIDQRVLATLKFISLSGFRPSVTALRCGKSLANTAFDATGALSANALGDGVDISKINGIPVLGNQGVGSITDMMIHRLVTLQGSFRPAHVISLMTYASADNTVGASDHGDRISIEFAPLFVPNSKSGQQVAALLRPRQWIQLINRLGQIDNPVVATQPSSAAIPVTSGP